jgi:hypothetical protein
MEHKNGENTRTYHTAENPGLEFAPLGFCIIHYSADERIYNRVKNSEKSEHYTDCGKSSVREGYDVGQEIEKIHTDQ